MATEANFPGSGADCGSGNVDAAPCVDLRPPEASAVDDKGLERRAESTKSPPRRISFSINSILQDDGNLVRGLQQAESAGLAASTAVEGSSKNRNDFTPLTFFYRDKLLGPEKSQTSPSEAGRSADALISSWTTMSATSPFVYCEYTVHVVYHIW